MTYDTNTTIWHISHPKVWPKTPSLMSFSTLSKLEMCPRCWALSATEYPNIWDRSGYPRLLNSCTIEGIVIHRVLAIITKAMSKNGCLTVAESDATQVLKELGGYTALIQKSLEHTLSAYQTNPRATPVLEQKRRELEARIPYLRVKVQSLLSRVRLEPRYTASSKTISPTGRPMRIPLQYGSYSEMELKAPELNWHGFVDLLTLSPTNCEIREFKTGDSKDKHSEQLKMYSLLWLRDREINPSGRLVDSLVISYNDGDVMIPSPGEAELDSIEVDLRSRTESARETTMGNPPQANLDEQHCKYCHVRHLCEEYWNNHKYRELPAEMTQETSFDDLEVKLTSRHGPTSWDGIIEASAIIVVGQSVLLHAPRVSLIDLHPGQRIRMLNIHLVLPKQDITYNKSTPAIVTIGTGSEIFLVQ